MIEYTNKNSNYLEISNKNIITEKCITILFATDSSRKVDLKRSQCEKEVGATKFIPWHCNFEGLQLEILCKNLQFVNQNLYFYELNVQVNDKSRKLHESCPLVYGK